jgi:hypothetical protein
LHMRVSGRMGWNMPVESIFKSLFMTEGQRH